MKFGIAAFSAWSPGLENDEQWRNWAASVNLVELADKPKCKDVKPMVRRRLTRWGRMALEVATACCPVIDDTTPTIFASRNGDTHRTFKLLDSIAEGEPLSPTAFSLSVHNSSSGIFSMIKQIFGPAIAVASGLDTLGQAFIEANSLLECGQDKVLLVYTDEPIAEYYLPDVDEKEMPLAIGCVLTRCEDGVEPAIQVNYVYKEEKRTFGHSMAIDFLSFWYSNRKDMRFQSKRLEWILER